MRDWILGLQKAAIEHRGGARADQWGQAEEELGQQAPEELRDLYEYLNGATFASGVVLHPLTGPGDGRNVIAQSRTGNAGLPTDDTWRFGRKDTAHLAAIRKRRLSEIDQAEVTPPPDWLEELPDDAWVYVARDEANSGLRVYRTLEHMLTSMIPPAESEDFGERTLARARSLVEAAVTELSALDAARVEKVVTTVTGEGGPRRPKQAARKKPASRKAAGKKAPAKKAAAKKRPAKKAVAKKRPAKKAAAKKRPAKKKAAPKKAAARKSAPKKGTKRK